MSRRRFLCFGAEHEIEARFEEGRLLFSDGGDDRREVEAIAVGEGVWLLRDDDGTARTVTVVREGTTWWVHLEGRTWELERLVGGAGAGAAAGSLTAPMPGTVEEVYVSVGDEVEAGTPLLAVSAMKMQIDIRAPHDGVVRRIDHGEGDQVRGGEPLAVVEPVSEGGNEAGDDEGTASRNSEEK